MLKKSPTFVLILLSLLALFSLIGCTISDNNKQDSLTSGTISGFGSSGGPAARVSLIVGNNPVGSGATTTITIIITDSRNRRTDASIILTSSGGGFFNGSTSNTSLNGNTLGGSFIATYTAPTITGQADIVITATVSGRAISGSVSLTVTP